MTQTRVSESEKKRKQIELRRKINKTRVYIGRNIDKWKILKKKVGGADTRVVWHLLKVHDEHCAIEDCCIKPADKAESRSRCIRTRSRSSKSSAVIEKDPEGQLEEDTESIEPERWVLVLKLVITIRNSGLTPFSA